MAKQSHKVCVGKYQEILSVHHALYRLATNSDNLKDLFSGILRILQNEFSAVSTALVISYPNKHHYVKAIMKKGKKFTFKKNGRKNLSKREKDIMNSEKIFFSKKTIALPLIYRATLGVITVQRDKKNENFNKLDKRFLNVLTEATSLIIRNFQVYDEHHKTIFGTVKALNQFLRQYTPTSSMHSESIHKILQVLAPKLNLTQKQVVAIEHATLLHDAGKIDIPSGLLTKDTPLTEEERKIIRKHPKKGVDILRNLQALRPVIPIIMYHHEKYDGSGYPSGLKKRQIPLEARILTIIDAFDAMLFGRPYKKRLSLEKTIQELKKNKGTQFDPKVVEAFVKTLKKKDIKKHLKAKPKKV